MNYQIELRHLHYFKVLAEELHFRRAAEKLFIAQPGLTRQIKQMEEIYGIKLFERGKRSVTLTHAGMLLKKEADLILYQMDQVRNQLQKMADGKVAEVKIGFIGSVVQTVLPGILLQMKKKHPLIDMNLEELSNENQLLKVRNNEIDLGFVRLDHPPSDLHILGVHTEHFCLVVPKGYNHVLGQKELLESLKHEPFILFSKAYSTTYYDLVMSIFHDAGYHPRLGMKTVNALAIFKMVEQGLGFAIIPSSLKTGYRAEVDFIELTDIRQRTTLSVIWNPLNRNPGTRALLAIIKACDR